MRSQFDGITWCKTTRKVPVHLVLPLGVPAAADHPLRVGGESDGLRNEATGPHCVSLQRYREAITGRGHDPLGGVVDHPWPSSELILELLSSGMTADEILADYEDLEAQDILAALEFATHVTRVKRIQLTSE